MMSMKLSAAAVCAIGALGTGSASAAAFSYEVTSLEITGTGYVPTGVPHWSDPVWDLETGVVGGFVPGVSASPVPGATGMVADYLELDALGWGGSFQTRLGNFSYYDSSSYWNYSGIDLLDRWPEPTAPSGAPALPEAPSLQHQDSSVISIGQADTAFYDQYPQAWSVSAGGWGHSHGIVTLHGDSGHTLGWAKGVGEGQLSQDDALSNGTFQGTGHAYSAAYASDFVFSQSSALGRGGASVSYEATHDRTFEITIDFTVTGGASVEVHFNNSGNQSVVRISDLGVSDGDSGSITLAGVMPAGSTTIEVVAVADSYASSVPAFDAGRQATIDFSFTSDWLADPEQAFAEAMDQWRLDYGQWFENVWMPWYENEWLPWYKGDWIPEQLLSQGIWWYSPAVPIDPENDATLRIRPPMYDTYVALPEPATLSLMAMAGIATMARGRSTRAGRY